MSVVISNVNNDKGNNKEKKGLVVQQRSVNKLHPKLFWHLREVRRLRELPEHRVRQGANDVTGKRKGLRCKAPAKGKEKPDGNNFSRRTNFPRCSTRSPGGGGRRPLQSEWSLKGGRFRPRPWARVYLRRDGRSLPLVAHGCTEPSSAGGLFSARAPAAASSLLRDLARPLGCSPQLAGPPPRSLPGRMHLLPPAERMQNVSDLGSPLSPSPAFYYPTSPHLQLQSTACSAHAAQLVQSPDGLFQSIPKLGAPTGVCCPVRTS